MKCTKCGQSIPSPKPNKSPKFPELKNWKEFMNEQLIKNLNKEKNNDNKKINT